MCVSIQGHSSNGNYNQKTLWRFLHWIIASVTLRHRHAWVFESMTLILNILNNFSLLKHLDLGIGCLVFHEMTLRHGNTKVISVLRLSKRRSLVACCCANYQRCHCSANVLLMPQLLCEENHKFEPKVTIGLSLPTALNLTRYRFLSCSPVCAKSTCNAPYLASRSQSIINKAVMI